MKHLLQNLRTVLHDPTIAGREVVILDDEGQPVEAELGELLEEAIRLLSKEERHG